MVSASRNAVVAVSQQGMAEAAQEAKSRGNRAFHDGNFEEAALHYSTAIDVDPGNAVLYNNRAAAYLQTRRFTEALADATKSNSLAPSAKAMGRIAQAHRGLGNTDKALEAYRAAQAMAPGVAEYKSAADDLERRPGSTGSSTRDSSAGTQPVASDAAAKLYLLNVLVLLSAVVHVPCMVLAPGLSTMAWHAGVGAFGLRQLNGLASMPTRASDPPRGFNLAYAKHFVSIVLPSTFCGQWLILCVFLFLARAPPLHLLYAAMCLYCAIDCVITLHAVSEAALGKLGPLGRLIEQQALNRFASRIRQNRDYLLAQAAMCEVVSGVLAPLTGLPMLGWALFWQFLKFRYRADAFVRMGFQALSQQLSKLFHHPRCPAVLGSAFDKLRETLHRMATA